MPFTSKTPGSSLDAERESAREESRNCEFCAGNGLVTVYHPTRQVTAAHCRCAIGAWMRARTEPRLQARIPWVEDICSGRSRWLLEDPNESPVLYPVSPCCSHCSQPMGGGRGGVGWKCYRGCDAVVKKKTGRGASLESPPRPAGAQIRSIPVPDCEHSVKACPRQEPEENNGSGQRARLDSNQQPSDSKFQLSESASCPNSSAKSPGIEVSDGENSEKTRGFPIREFSHAEDLEPSPESKSHPVGRKADA